MNQKNVHVIHENSVWSEPLFGALSARGHDPVDWHLRDFQLRFDESPPQGVFYNRMSASSHTRGHRYAPEMTACVLSWLEANGRKVLNGSRALMLELSKITQYASLQQAGLVTPKTVACMTSEQVLDAFDRFAGAPVITKHNRAGKGLGVKLFRAKDALADYVHGEEFDPSVDGITLVQQYIESPEPFITRVEFIGREFLYAVRVDTSEGFELCPADACAVDSMFCPVDGSSTPEKFQIIEDFAEQPGHPEMLARMAQLMHEQSLDVSAFEFIVDSRGNKFVYDINTNTNYNSDAENAVGVSAMERLADYLIAALD
ncbi:MAG TPA: alpha-L-glutamate ligase [Myxococcales bacterium]|nr:alpha-L-glutamate ligase [Myxococcales bacterium]HAN31727.1 alpha-L-glutamate ligase [Myxococcales bacterium]